MAADDGGPRLAAPPPLWALPFAIAIALSWMLAHVPSFYERRAWKNAAWTRYVRTRLDRDLPDSADSGLTLVAVGTSSTRHALRAASLDDGRGRTYRVVRVTRDSGDWDPVPTLTECVRRRPSVLLVEVNQLYFHVGAGTLLAYPWLRERAKGWPQSEDGYFDLFSEPSPPYDSRRPSSLELREQRAKMQEELSLAVIDDSLASLLESASRDGVLAVLVDLIPRRTDWPVLRPDQLRRVDGAVDALARRTGARVLRCPFADEAYVSVAHLSAAGSARFETCLRRHLDEWRP